MTVCLGLAFEDTASQGRVWAPDNTMGAVSGDMLSVASPSVRDGEYSCLTLHFSEPILRGSDISFQWSLGRGTGVGSNGSALLVWFALTADDQPPMLALGQPGISRVQSGFSDWMGYSAIAIDRVVPELRWCYFGAKSQPGPV